MKRKWEMIVTQDAQEQRDVHLRETRDGSYILSPTYYFLGIKGRWQDSGQHNEFLTAQSSCQGCSMRRTIVEYEEAILWATLPAPNPKILQRPLA